MRRLWFLAVLAPLLVIIGLGTLGSVTAVFVSYHLTLCLLVPAILSRREGLSWRAHGRRLGLTPSFEPAPDATGSRRLALGLLLGGLFALGAPVAYWAAPGLFPDGEHLRMVLRSWGADPERPAALLVFLLLANGTTEELFWRGYLQDRLLRGPLSGCGLVVLFTSYHVLTIGKLVIQPGAAAIMLSGILIASVFWTWTRARWGTVWPALLSHTGATAGYLAVCWNLLS